MLKNGFQSRILERSADGDNTIIVYRGSQAEMEQLADSLEANSPDAPGMLKSLRIKQESPRIWCCECRYETDRGGNISAPDTTFGKKSATLRGSTHALRLSEHPAYRMCWDHQLIAAPGITRLPTWWDSAATPRIGIETDAANYRWQRPGTQPVRTAAGVWQILAEPTKPGVETFDWSCYTITERARFRSDRSAGRMIAGKLNQIGTPVTTFGITGGNWKCCDAGVTWNGRCWVATLVWSRSRYETGWDTDLYPDGVES